MWRRYADEIYAIVILVVFTAEAVALGLLTSFFVLRLIGIAPQIRAEAIVLSGIAVTALAVMGLAIYVVGYHGASEARERRRIERAGEWTERWVRVVFFGDRAPRPPIPSEAADALLDLYEATKGSEGERIKALVERYHLGMRLSAALDAPAARRRLTFAFRPRSTARRLEALEALAKARIPAALGTILELCGDADPAVRRMALRAGARTVARVPSERRDRATEAFVEVLGTAEVPAGSVEEALLLLEDSAPGVIGRLLRRRRDRGGGGWAADRGGTRRFGAVPAATPGLLVARALEATGRLNLHDLVPEVARHVTDADPEIRASALRALADLRALPDDARPGVEAALHDEVDFVRLQAARCATLLPREVARERLNDLMGDHSWWVRRAAARSLLDLGSSGAELAWVARTHADRYAREMAVQVLLDAGRIEHDQARSLREAR